MNSAITDRFDRTLGEWDFTTVSDGMVITKPAPAPKTEEPKIEKSPAISPEQLSSMLSPTPAPEQPTNPNEGHFRSLRDFVNWYLTNREKFDEEKREALNTLYKVEDLIAKGCKCKENERDEIAHAYFEDFFNENHRRGNDLIATIKKLMQVEKVFFYNPRKGVEPFLVA